MCIALNYFVNEINLALCFSNLQGLELWISREFQYIFFHIFFFNAYFLKYWGESESDTKRVQG